MARRPRKTTLPKKGATTTCNAATRSGTHCKRGAGWGTDHPGSGRCKLHGGASRRGVDHPNARTLRYSKHLPSRLLARYEEAEADPTMLELRAEIALVDARIAEVLAQLDTGESGMAWERLRTARAQFVRAETKSDQAAALGDILRTIKDGSQEWMHWKDVVGMINTRQRLVESERRRMTEMQQTVTVAEALALVRTVMAAVNEHADPDVRRRIHADLSVVLGGHGPSVLRPVAGQA